MSGPEKLKVLDRGRAQKSRDEKTPNDNDDSGGPIRKQRSRTGQGTPYDRDENLESKQSISSTGSSLGDSRDPVEGKVLVTNLDKDVTEDDIKGIFIQIGTLKNVIIYHDRDGRSLGTAEVSFHKAEDAEKAIEEYDEAEVDGKPMFLKLVTTVASSAKNQEKNNERGSPTDDTSRNRGSQNQNQNDGGDRPRRNRNTRRNRQRTNNSGGIRGRRNRRRRSGGGGNGGGGSGGGRRLPSKDELDADLDSYHSQKNSTKSTLSSSSSLNMSSAGQPPAPIKVKMESDQTTTTKPEPQNGPQNESKTTSV